MQWPQERLRRAADAIAEYLHSEPAVLDSIAIASAALGAAIKNPEELLCELQAPHEVPKRPPNRRPKADTDDSASPWVQELTDAADQPDAPDGPERGVSGV